jgi:hypothetical protein
MALPTLVSLNDDFAYFGNSYCFHVMHGGLHFKSCKVLHLQVFVCRNNGQKRWGELADCSVPCFISCGPNREANVVTFLHSFTRVDWRLCFFFCIDTDRSFWPRDYFFTLASVEVPLPKSLPHKIANAMLADERESNIGTNSIESSPSWETDGYSASQVPRFLWNPKVHYRVQKGPPLAPVLSHMYPIHTFQSYFPKIQSYIFFPLTPRPCGWEVGWESVDWIHLAQDRNQWRAHVNTKINLRVL